MNYIDVFRTSDRHEIAILKNLFDEENITYRTHGEAMDSAANIGGLGNDGMRIEVEESERERAAEIIKRSGFLGQPHNISQTERKKTSSWKMGVCAACRPRGACCYYIFHLVYERELAILTS